mgnify:CR=1 FL=1
MWFYVKFWTKICFFIHGWSKRFKDLFVRCYFNFVLSVYHSSKYREILSLAYNWRKLSSFFFPSMTYPPFFMFYFTIVKKAMAFQFPRGIWPLTRTVSKLKYYYYLRPRKYYLNEHSPISQYYSTSSLNKILLIYIEKGMYVRKISKLFSQWNIIQDTFRIIKKY